MSLSESEKQWFSDILGFADQQVDDVRLDKEAQELHLTLTVPEPPYVCPVCGYEHRSLHDRRLKRVRDKPWADHTVFVHVPILRIRCCRGATPIELPAPDCIKKNSATRGGFAK